jgi:hypothetical protein
MFHSKCKLLTIGRCKSERNHFGLRWRCASPKMKGAPPFQKARQKFLEPSATLGRQDGYDLERVGIDNDDLIADQEVQITLPLRLDVDNRRR